MRVAELRAWFEDGGYDRILRGEYVRRGEPGKPFSDDVSEAGRSYAEGARETVEQAAATARRVADTLRAGFAGRER
jgi:hypothetical protein